MLPGGMLPCPAECTPSKQIPDMEGLFGAERSLQCAVYRSAVEAGREEQPAPFKAEYDGINVTIVTAIAKLCLQNQLLCQDRLAGSISSSMLAMCVASGDRLSLSGRYVMPRTWVQALLLNLINAPCNNCAL